MPELEAKLRQVGLSDKEAKVYLALLQSGRTTAYKIAAKAGVKVPTAYVVLEELRQKDLVLKTPDSKRQLFIAQDPAFFFERLSNDVRSLESVLPRLQALTKRKEESSVVTYEGHVGIKDSLQYKLESMRGKNFLGFYSDLNKPDQKLLRVMTDWSRQCLGQKTGAQVVAPNSSATEVWVRETAEKYTGALKLIDKSLFSSEVSIEVAEDFVRIIDTKELQAVVVDNKRVADAFKQIFQMVWNGVEGEMRVGVSKKGQ